MSKETIANACTTEQMRKETELAMKAIVQELKASDEPLSKRHMLSIQYGDQYRTSSTAIISAIYELLDQGRIEYDSARRLVLCAERP